MKELREIKVMFTHNEIYDHLKSVSKIALDKLELVFSDDEFEELFATYFGLQFMGRDSLENACEGKEGFEYETGNCGTWMFDAIHSIHGRDVSKKFTDDKQDEFENIVSEYILSL